MSQLKKAELQEIRADSKETCVGPPVEVQFNPTSLRLRISNRVEGGQSIGRQRRQQNARSSTVLSLELVFDSADEDNDGTPVSVREKTIIVEKYVFPKEDGTETPPKLRFQWKDFIVTGIVESVDMDFDLFAPDGTPLRAKVNLSIKEQDSKLMLLKEGAGARNSGDAQTPDDGGDGRPGSAGSGGRSDRSAPALDGETAPEFAARQGLDPAAWRGLDADLSAGISLVGGSEVGFSAGINANAGIGLSTGVQAGMNVSLEASVGLEANVNASAGGSVSARLRANANANVGFALSAAGGVSAAIATVKIEQSYAAEVAAFQAFPAPNIPAASTALQRNPQARRSASAPDVGLSSELRTRFAIDRPSFTRLEPPRTPLLVTGMPGPSQQSTVPPRNPPPKADPRRISYGFGVPLRPSYGALRALQPPGLYPGKRSGRISDWGPIFSTDPATPLWIELPQRDAARASADAAQARMRGRQYGALYGANPRGVKP